MDIGFDEFAAAETARLLGLTRVLCGNDHDAWDLTQDALARVSARWDRLAHHDNVAAYARTTLANLHKNSRRRRREVLVADPPDPAAVEESGRLDLDAWLDTAMRSLPHRQRVAVALTYLEDRPIGEVAEILGCGVATAARRTTSAAAAATTSGVNRRGRAGRGPDGDHLTADRRGVPGRLLAGAAPGVGTSRVHSPPSPSPTCSATAATSRRSCGPRTTRWCLRPQPTGATRSCGSPGSARPRGRWRSGPRWSAPGRP